MGEVNKVFFKEYGDERGNLVVVEGEIDIPFTIKRLFYIFNSDSEVVRGQHANRKSEFILINIAGSCKIKVIGSDEEEQIFVLDQPHEGLYLPTMVWKDMYDFSPDSLLLVLSNEHYEPDEYIRNYTDFINEVRHE